MGSDFLHLDPAAAGAGGLTRWLAAALRDAVDDARLPVGSRLPATRVLAAELGVSRGVVVEAYQRLIDEGRAVTRRSGGTLIAAAAAPPAKPAAPAPVRAATWDLSPGLPDLSAFPRAAWLRAERDVLAHISAGDLGYGDPRGTPVLRSELAGWLGRRRGIRVHPEEIVIVAGVAQGLALLAQVLRARGVGAVAVEDPGSRGTREQLVRWGLRTHAIPVDEHGLDVEALDATACEAVLVTPAHQFPTGVVLAPTRRRALLDWAGAGRVVIEDDYDAEHRYDRAPVAALHALAPDRVAYTGSTSKTLAPALRIGWLVPPAHLREEVVAAKHASDLANPTLPQLVLAALLTSGELDRHLRRVRARQRTRRDAMLDALREHLPQARVHGVAAGLHLLITLPDHVDDLALASRAREAGVLVQPLSWHRQHPGPPGLLLGYAAQTPGQIHAAIAHLATFWPEPGRDHQPR